MREKPGKILNEMRMKTLGGRIEYIISDLKMKPADLARRLNVTPQAVSQWMHNQSVPNLENLGEIALLNENTNIKWFFTGKGDPYMPESVETKRLKAIIKGLEGRCQLMEDIITHLTSRLNELQDTGREKKRDVP